MAIESKPQVPFGSAFIVFPDMALPQPDQGLRQTRDAANADACPVVGKLIVTRGAETMLGRYQGVNQWYFNILQWMDEVNGPLAQEFRRPHLRNANEPIGEFEEDAVPRNMRHLTVGIGSPLGYGFPRVVVDLMSRFEVNSPQEYAAMVFIQNLVHQIAQQTTDRLEFILRFVDTLTMFAQYNDDTQAGTRFLRQIVGTGKMAEDHCFTLNRQILHELTNRPDLPFLSTAYLSLTPAQRAENHIVDILDLPIHHRAIRQDGNHWVMYLVWRDRNNYSTYYIERRQEQVVAAEVDGETIYRHVGWISHRLPETYSEQFEVIQAALKKK